MPFTPLALTERYATPDGYHVLSRDGLNALLVACPKAPAGTACQPVPVADPTAKEAVATAVARAVEAMRSAGCRLHTPPAAPVVLPSLTQVLASLTPAELAALAAAATPKPAEPAQVPAPPVAPSYPPAAP